jgi:hypothetical protein
VTTAGPADLESLFVELAAEAGASVAAKSGTEFRRGTKLFAVASGNTVELALDPEIADAVLGTPSTAASSRGANWVQLTGDPVNPHDVDRARAWFLSAWRNASG